MWKLSPKGSGSTHPTLISVALPAEGDGEVELQKPGMGTEGTAGALSPQRDPHPWGRSERIPGTISVAFKGSWVCPAALG